MKNHNSKTRGLGFLFMTILLLSASYSLGEIPKGDIVIKLETVATGLTAPIYATNAGDGSGRLFIVEQSGQIRIVENDVLLPTPFLDISDKLPALNAFFDERGLLGLAFHPDYATNGRFFIRYSVPRDGDSSEPCFGTSRGCHSEVLAEYSVSAGNPNLSDPTSEIILFTIEEPQFNHDAGNVAFGPDGFLYFTLGDGGGAHDGLADSPPSHGPTGNGQNIETALGSILRIDVDNPPQAPLAYAIPADNPFVGKAGLDEIYAYGMRNPYRFSFDDGPGGDGRLFLADVGQNLFEEINIVEKGGNYGWVIREGFHCFDPLNPFSPPLSCPGTGPLGEPLLDPIVEYAHPGSGFSPVGGITIVGGFVYRGSRSPSLVGKYIFGDFSGQFSVPSGRLYYLEESAPGDFEIREFQIGADDNPYGLFLKGFGEGEDGEIYACGSIALAPFGESGVVERIVAPAQPFLDIKPGSCPNPLNRRSQGVLPVALVGVEGFDIADIDVSSLTLSRGGPVLLLTASLDGEQANAGAGTGSSATGQAFITVNIETNELIMDLNIEGLLGDQTAQHFHGPAIAGVNAGVLFAIPGPGSFEDFSMILTDVQKQVILDGLAYVNVHTTRDPAGEIRGQILPVTVTPIRIEAEDVATPFSGDLCDCAETGPDGIADLVLKFDTQDIVSKLLQDGSFDEFIVLTVKGNLTEPEGGDAFSASDCVRIVPPRKNDHSNNGNRNKGRRR
ncbi:MAG: CHRD domain-containing protein [Phycisphaerae bacterium]|nr:CHRD domain-containing protein [Phycisphaerae bacterium]NIP53242.1 CHRD domain-containing protein [Phycisphaerae bacterium]NIS52268.1 CHRD domain-containing protein [Phycisphaerae bacterium]NIU09814.1 CHRD domain-containing protein [Phycisphaerae bacterium]NIU59452.1 CHRD domain-containing protein [Phycisphaerae bacterium]